MAVLCCADPDEQVFPSTMASPMETLGTCVEIAVVLFHRDPMTAKPSFADQLSMNMASLATISK